MPKINYRYPFFKDGLAIYELVKKCPPLNLSGSILNPLIYSQSLNLILNFIYQDFNNFGDER